MKQFFVWVKFVGALLGLLGLGVTAYLWAFVSNMTDKMPLDLVWGYSILDQMITLTLAGFGILAFVYAIAEKMSWKNLLFGLPMFALNALVLFTWWHMELCPGTDFNVATFLVIVCCLLNFVSASIFLVRRFAVPDIAA